MNELQGRFVWYELLSTDIAAAAKFYGEVVGWSARDASTAEFAYHLLAAGEAPVCGLMDLPEEGRRQGARPRWVGYVAVDDADAVVERFRRFSGAVYVPPTDSNIGRIAIVADPEAASLAIVQGLKTAELPRREQDGVGCIGWHELFAADSRKALAFYAEVFGWREAKGDAGLTDGYRLFSADGHVVGGMLTKLPSAPFPFWLYYFNVSDLDRAIASVNAGLGQVFQGPTELVGGVSIVRCIDPQGAMFALRGPRGKGAETNAVIGFSAEWGSFASRGQVIAERKRNGPPKPSSRPKR